MSLVAKVPSKYSGSDKPKVAPLDIGTYPVYISKIIDLGTHTGMNQNSGKLDTRRKLNISFEFPFEKAVFDESKGEQPRMMSKMVNLTLFESSCLRMIAEASGIKLSEGDSFNIEDLLTRSIQLSVVHYEKDGETKAKINWKTFAPLMKGLNLPEMENEPVFFFINEDGSYSDDSVFESLPKWQKEMIQDSQEGKRQQSNVEIKDEVLEA